MYTRTISYAKAILRGERERHREKGRVDMAISGYGSSLSGASSCDSGDKADAGIQVRRAIFDGSEIKHCGDIPTGKRRTDATFDLISIS